MLLQVHDELIFEVDEAIADELALKLAGSYAICITTLCTFSG